MSPRSSMPSGSHMRSGDSLGPAGRNAWQGWLDELTKGADRLEADLSRGEPLSFPGLTPPPLGPGSPGLPHEFLPAARHVLARLERLERVAATQRDRLGAQLRELSARRMRPAAVPGYELGSALDVAG